MTGKVALPGIPRTIWALGFVSLFMDVSSELVHSLLPVFMVGSLGLSMQAIGLIEGAAEATALIADVAPAAIRGACFGLRQSMDTVGAFLGPLLAILLMLWSGADIGLVLWFAVLPALLCLAMLAFGVAEPVAAGTARHFRVPISRAALRRFPPAYWWVVGIGALFALARFSEAFLVLRAQALGVPVSWVPLVMVAMAAAYMLSAYPVGHWSDRVGRHRLLGVGLLLLVLADLLLARAESVAAALLGVLLWGLHMGFSQGVLATLVADTTPAELKGTAFGLFNLVSGVALLLASGLAGALWQAHGAASTFHAGALFAGLALLLLLLRRRAARGR